ncbi:D-amino-acid transaminase, chloroplastic isoform X2 [Physcomitrium patens]|uniref:D-amino-acid transaminase, chloroplastic isoform X2 n=1 Tax=Physcomitrium patens TaxID=3218 RepID=UPI000D15F78A|nr:D-amino-acid transaminase, chloroplastic-like isoform X2 [Physcomitrium patens]|eukprot:XP_024368816.1 D-amino-acid transaminase, chloroplastic-like isoform X2 [Physcomitrella patens]
MCSRKVLMQILGREVADEAGGLAIGSAKVTIPVLGLTEIISRLQKEASAAKFKNFRSMYSSIVGAITTDVAAMVIPLDDHMVHRGHSVFDTSILVNGYLYELDAHLDRFLSSATKAKITPPFDRATIREILLQTVSAGKCQHGILRFWMSVGRGNFELSAKNCLESSLFACLVEENFIDDEPLDGLKVITSTVPIKHKDFATIKSTNYLLNALVVMEAEEKGANVGIWLDEDGNIAEGQNMNVGFLTNEGELLLPPFDRILSGCTAKRVLELVPQLIKENAIPGLKSVKQTKISLSEAKIAAEMMIIISGEMIMPVVEWDGKPVGNGNPGRVSVALRKCMRQDMLVTPSAVLTLVPSPKPV